MLRAFALSAVPWQLQSRTSPLRVLTALHAAHGAVVDMHSSSAWAMTFASISRYTLTHAGAGQPGSPILVRCASQLVRAATEAKGHQQQQGHSWVAYAAAAAAAATGASYLLSAQPILSARASPATPSEQPSSAAEAAVTALLLTPLSQVLQGTHVPQAELQQYIHTLAKEHAALQCWELSAALWGIAHLLLPSSSPQHLPEDLQQLQVTAQQRLHSMPLFPAILAGWSLLTMDAADDQVWPLLVQRVAAADVRELDEAAQLYLAHAAMQEAARQAAVAAAGGGGGGAGGGSEGGGANTTTTTSSNSSSSSSSSTGSHSSSLAAPRATKEEVEALVAGLPKKMRTRVMAAYQDYIPFHPYVEGCYMPQLTLLKLLPDLISTAKAAAAQHPGSVYAASFSGLSGADVAAAATLVSDPGCLGRLKRETAFHWRNDTLLDRHQTALNQLVYVLQRQMSQVVAQPPDVDILLPVQRAALFVTGPDSGAEHSNGGSSSSSSSSSRVSSCAQLVTSLLRTGFAAPSGSSSSSFNRQLQPGLAAAKQRCFNRRGWRCISIPLQEVEAVVGQGKVTNHQRSVVERNAALQVLLSNALEG